MQYVVVIGNLARVVGPFASRSEANDNAEAISGLPQWRGYSTQVVALAVPSAIRRCGACDKWEVVSTACTNSVA